MNGVITWVGTWLITIVGLAVLAKTAWGRPIVYGMIWLAVVLLLVSHAEELAQFYNVEALQLNG